MEHLVQCAVPTGCNQQIHFACFRYKSLRVPFFPRHSHFDAMSGFSLPSHCRAEGVIPSHFSVENQTNPSVLGFAFHDGKRGCPRSVRPCPKNQQAGEQEMHGNSQSLRSDALIFVDSLIEMRMFSSIASKYRQESER